LKTFSFRYPQRKKSHGYFDRARSLCRTLCESLSHSHYNYHNGCSHNTLQQQSPDVHRSNPLWELKTVEANQPHDTIPTSLPLLQPAQCPLEMWEIFMRYPVESGIEVEEHSTFERQTAFYTTTWSHLLLYLTPITSIAQSLM